MMMRNPAAAAAVASLIVTSMAAGIHFAVSTASERELLPILEHELNRYPITPYPKSL